MRVCTTGTFDIPHFGHAIFLQQAAALGDSLIVGVLTDSYVLHYKGINPFFSTVERAALIHRAGYITQPVRDQAAFFRANADIIVVGSEWARRDYLKQIDMTQDELDRLGVTIAYVPYTKGISTSIIEDRIAAGRNPS